MNTSSVKHTRPRQAGADHLGRTPAGRRRLRRARRAPDASPRRRARNPTPSKRAELQFGVLLEVERTEDEAGDADGHVDQEDSVPRRVCTSSPPRTGPSAGATTVGMARIDDARARSAGGTHGSSIAVPTGTSIPPPTPWSTRKAMSASTFQAMPQSPEVSVNMNRANRNGALGAEPVADPARGGIHRRGCTGSPSRPTRWWYGPPRSPRSSPGSPR